MTDGDVCDLATSLDCTQPYHYSAFVSEGGARHIFFDEAVLGGVRGKGGETGWGGGGGVRKGRGR